MKNLKATKGGCWFCGKDGCDAFDWEFDTNLHLKCLKEVLDKNPNDPEADIMKYLIKL